MKTNFDGAMFAESDQAGIGVVVRNNGHGGFSREGTQTSVHRSTGSLGSTQSSLVRA